MIDSIREYIFQVVATSVICGVCTSLTDKKTLPGSIIQIFAGIIMAITFISPLVDFRFNDLKEYYESISVDSNSVVEEGTEYHDELLNQSIKQQTQAYIVDKASSMNADLTVEVTLSCDEFPFPESATISGRVSPYVKNKLSNIIESDIGISKENQIWKQSD